MGGGRVVDEVVGVEIVGGRLVGGVDAVVMDENSLAEIDWMCLNAEVVGEKEIEVVEG